MRASRSVVADEMKKLIRQRDNLRSFWMKYPGALTTALTRCVLELARGARTYFTFIEGRREGRYVRKLGVKRASLSDKSGRWLDSLDPERADGPTSDRNASPPKWRSIPRSSLSPIFGVSNSSRQPRGAWRGRAPRDPWRPCERQVAKKWPRCGRRRLRAATAARRKAKSII